MPYSWGTSIPASTYFAISDKSGYLRSYGP